MILEALLFILGTLYGYKQVRYIRADLDKILKRAIPVGFMTSLTIMVTAVIGITILSQSQGINNVNTQKIISTLSLPTNITASSGVAILWTVFLMVVGGLIAFIIGSVIGYFIGEHGVDSKIFIAILAIIAVFVLASGNIEIGLMSLIAVAVLYGVLYAMQSPEYQLDLEKLTDKKVVAGILTLLVIGSLFAYYNPIGFQAGDDDNAYYECFDTDGGLNGGVKGAVIWHGTKLEDSCVNNQVDELICDPATRQPVHQTIGGCTCLDGKCANSPTYTDITILGVQTDKTIIEEDDVATLTISLRNNAPYTATRHIEAYIYPHKWAGDVYPISYSAINEYYWSGCCIGNTWGDKSLIEMPPYSDAQITMYVYMPGSDMVDACNNKGSVVDPNGKYDIVVGLVQSCYSQAIPGSGGYYGQPVIIPVTKPTGPTTTQANNCVAAGTGTACTTSCQSQWQQGRCDVSGAIACINACNGGTTTTTTLPEARFVVQSISAPISTPSGKSVQVSLQIYNAGIAGSKYVETCIYPVNWKGTAYAAMSAIATTSCCPANEYCAAKTVTLNAGETETVVFYPVAPSINSIDHCNSLGSAWSYTGFEVVGGVANSGCKSGYMSYKVSSISVVTTPSTTTTTTPSTKTTTTTSTTNPQCLSGAVENCLTPTGQYGIRSCIGGVWGVCSVNTTNTTTTLPVCNNDKVCGSGENWTTCVNDCPPPTEVIVLASVVLVLIAAAVYQRYERY